MSYADTRIPLPTTCCGLRRRRVHAVVLATGQGEATWTQADRRVAFVLVPHHFTQQTRGSWVGQAPGRPRQPALCASPPHRRSIEDGRVCGGTKEAPDGPQVTQRTVLTHTRPCDCGFIAPSRRGPNPTQERRWGRSQRPRPALWAPRTCLRPEPARHPPVGWHSWWRPAASGSQRRVFMGPGNIQSSPRSTSLLRALQSTFPRSGRQRK